MLKINLLPSYIQTRRQVKIACGVVAVLVVLEVGGLLYAKQAPQATHDQLTAKRADVERQLQELNALGSKAGTVIAAEAALAPKYDFIKHMLEYNVAYPQLYSRTASYTYKNAMFTNLSATSNTLKFDAYVSGPSDVSVLMMGLMRNADFQGLPQVSGVPGYDAKEQATREKAGAADVAPSMIVGGYSGASGAGGAPGAPGAPGGGGNGPSMGAPGPGGNGPGAGSPSPPPMMSSGGGGNGPGGAMGGSSGGSSAGDLAKLALTTALVKPTGFIINVTCALAKPITRPPYGTADSQAGAGGGGGSSSGGMGGNGPGGGMMPSPPGGNGPRR